MNEILLNIQTLQKEMNDALGSSIAFEIGFCQLLQFSSVESLSSIYRDFGKIDVQFLGMTANKFSAEISKEKFEKCSENYKVGSSSRGFQSPRRI